MVSIIIIIIEQAFVEKNRFVCLARWCDWKYSLSK